MAVRFSLAPFLGLSTSLDSRYIPDQSASDMRNVAVEDGVLRLRRGYKLLGSSFANQNGPVSGFDYVSGYDANSSFIDEYVSVERSSVGPNSYFPISRSASDGSYVGGLTDGGSTVTLSSGDWRAFGFRDRAYVYCPTHTPSVYRHTIGTLTSMTPMATPATPNPPTFSVTYGATSYSTVNWTSLNVSTGISYTGSATSTNSSVNSDLLTIGHSASSNLASSVTIDLNGTSQGVSDWSYNDVFGVQLRTVATSTTFRVTPDTVRLSLINNDGSPITFTPVETTYSNSGDPNQMDLSLRFEFSGKVDRNQWDNIRKIKLEYTVTGSSGTATNNRMSIRMWIGGVWVNDPVERGNEAYRCSFYDSTRGYESALSSRLWIPTSATYGAQVLPQLRGLGVHLTLNYDGFASGTSYDRVRFYKETNTDQVNFQNQSHLLNTSSSGSHVHKLTLAEVLLLPTYTATPVPFANVVAGCAYKSWVVWGLKGSYQNVRHSKVGNAEVLAQDTDQLDDETRGATFSLAGDEPLSLHESGDALVITGSSGVYAQTGDAPARMTPPQKVPGTRGCAGKWASAVWRDDQGQAGVVFVDRAGEGVWFVQVTNGFYGDRGGGYLVQELSKSIRGTIRSFLLDGQSITDTSKIRVAVDEATDSLWIVLKARAIRLGRASALSGVREWELYTFTLATNDSIAFVSGSPRRRLRWITQSESVSQNSAKIYDVGWDSVGNQWIEGSSRDGGLAMPAAYWKSKTFTSADTTRINHVTVEREDYSDTPQITVASTRQTANKTLTSGKRNARFGALQSGREHQFTVELSEGDGAIYRVEVEQFGALSARRQS